MESEVFWVREKFCDSDSREALANRVRQVRKVQSQFAALWQVRGGGLRSASLVSMQLLDCID